MTDEKKEIKRPFGESESLSPEQKIEFFQEEPAASPEKAGEPRPNLFGREKEELTRENLITKEAIRREIDIMELDDSLKKEATQKAKKVQTLGEEEKIKNLLEVAQIKGIVFSVEVAKQINDPYILDTFHDILVKEWVYYKQFLK